MADGKITIETSIDNAGALKDLIKLTDKLNQQGRVTAGAASGIFSKIGSAAKHSAAIAVTALAGVGTVSYTHLNARWRQPCGRSGNGSNT